MNAAFENVIRDKKPWELQELIARGRAAAAEEAAALQVPQQWRKEDPPGPKYGNNGCVEEGQEGNTLQQQIMNSGRSEKQERRKLIIGSAQLLVIVITIIFVTVSFYLTNKIRNETLVPSTPTTPATPITPTPSHDALLSSSCEVGLYYYTYHDHGTTRIGSVNVFDTLKSNVEVTTPNCNLRYLAFDHGLLHREDHDGGDYTTVVYGQCINNDWIKDSGNVPHSLVTVDLSSGKTKKMVDFPTSSLFGMASNPVDGHLYKSTTGGTDFASVSPAIRLMKIEKNWTFTGIGGGGGGVVPHLQNSAKTKTTTTAGVATYLFGFAIDSKGNAFGTNKDNLYSVDLKTGTMSLLGRLPFATDSIAFHGTELYGIGKEPPAPLFTIHVMKTTTNGRTNHNGNSNNSNNNETRVLTSIIKDTHAPYTYGGSICHHAAATV